MKKEENLLVKKDLLGTELKIGDWVVLKSRYYSGLIYEKIIKFSEEMIILTHEQSTKYSRKAYSKNCIKIEGEGEKGLMLKLIKD